MVQGLPGSPCIPPASPPIRCPAPGLGAGPESLPGLRAGYPAAPRPPPSPGREQRKPGSSTHRAGDAPPPAVASPSVGDWVRRGRPDLSPRTRRLSGGPGPASDPSPPAPPPYSPGFILSPARPPSRGEAPTRLSPEPPRALPPRPRRSPAKPLVFVLGFRGPPRGGARDSRGGILRFPTGFEKESRLSAAVPSGFGGASEACLCFPEPLLPLGSWAEGGMRASALFCGKSRRGKKGRDRVGARKETVSVRFAPFKGP